VFCLTTPPNKGRVRLSKALFMMNFQKVKEGGDACCDIFFFFSWSAVLKQSHKYDFMSLSETSYFLSFFLFALYTFFLSLIISLFPSKWTVYLQRY
jgi:hypothetical protein